MARRRRKPQRRHFHHHHHHHGRRRVIINRGTNRHDVDMIIAVGVLCIGMLIIGSCAQLLGLR